jgi:hypothetical protein
VNANPFPSVLFRWLRPRSLAAVPNGANAQLPAAPVTLRGGQVLTLRQPGAAAWLLVRRGAVWLTGTPGKVDVVLQAGDHFCLKNGHPFVVEALTEAELILTSRPKFQTLPGGQRL